MVRSFSVDSALVILAAFASACDPCPMGTGMQDGFCTPMATGGSVLDDPVTAGNFQQKFNIRRCQAAETCLVEEGYDKDFWNIVCDEPWEWNDACPFDLRAAEQCLEGDWGCASGPGVIYTDPAAICDEVYRCDE